MLFDELFGDPIATLETIYEQSFYEKKGENEDDVQKD